VIRRALTLAWAALALALAACAPEPPRPDPDVVARLAGEEVRHADFEAHLRRAIGESGAGLASEALSQLLDQYLTERLLARLAADRGLVATGAEPGVAAEALLAAAPRAAPTEAEISAWYESHRAALARAERVELQQILTEDRLAAERARREILAGADFATVARRVSVDPAAASGGQSGVLGREDLPPAFAEIVFRLPEGGVSEVIAADYGFHVFKVVRRLEAEVPALGAARAEIAARLVAERADQALARLVQEARSRYAVEVFDRNLPFLYRGAYPVARPYEKKS
jgi:peptidyl-prolyl cis-trans isomerase C/foldase protein PrsA